MVTPAGSTPPTMGRPFVEDPEFRKKRMKFKSIEEAKISLDNTYSFSVNSSNIDFVAWSTVGIPMVKPMDLRTIWGDSDLRLVTYEIPRNVLQKYPNKHPFKMLNYALNIKIRGVDPLKSPPHADDIVPLNEADTSDVDMEGETTTRDSENLTTVEKRSSEATFSTYNVTVNEGNGMNGRGRVPRENASTMGTSSNVGRGFGSESDNIDVTWRDSVSVSIPTGSREILASSFEEYEGEFSEGSDEEGDEEEEEGQDEEIDLDAEAYDATGRTADMIDIDDEDEYEMGRRGGQKTRTRRRLFRRGILRSLLSNAGGDAQDRDRDRDRTLKMGGNLAEVASRNVRGWFRRRVGDDPLIEIPETAELATPIYDMELDGDLRYLSKTLFPLCYMCR